MSDRISYAVGTTLGRDHFNWPTVTAAQLAVMTSNVRTVSCNLLTMLALSWRVREFTFSGDVSVAVNYSYRFTGSPTLNEVTLSGEWETAGEIFTPLIITTPVFGFPVTEDHAAQREADILRYEDQAQFPVGLHFLHSYGFRGQNYEAVNVSGHVLRTSTTPPDPPVIEADADYSQFSAQQATELKIFGLDQSEMAVVYDPETQLFLPHLSATMQVNPGTGLFFGVIPGEGFGTGTLTIDPVVAPPITVPMTGFVLLDQALVDLELISLDGSCNLTATATKFWEYDGTYDPVSGAQLLDPFR